MEYFDHKSIEARWQKRWREENLYKTLDTVPGRENFYTLVEFPYPSGDLHIGHWYAFAVPDIFVRAKRMQGANVLYPIGFDSFGLPAENAAIKHNVNPREWTYKNIESMEKQLENMGNAFDWSRKIVTSDPAYYKWTQWIFTKIYEKGLVYRGKALVNWDPVDKTVLANEQVLSDGTAERSGAVVEKKEMPQWFFAITKYADRLIDDLDELDCPEEIKTSQKNWIGRSNGAEVTFQIKDTHGADVYAASVFTTRIDTIFSGTFIIFAPEHTFVQSVKDTVSNWEEVDTYIKESQKRSDIERTNMSSEKTGVQLKGLVAINPANGEEIPVWISDFVLASYGTGTVFADAHDERDFEIAKKYNIPLAVSLKPSDGIDWEDIESLQKCFSGEGVLVNSKQFDGLTSSEARPQIISWLKELGRAEEKTHYKLRDWSVGRQRYWGCPIPIVYDPEGKAHPVPEEHLPWLLPDDVDFTPTGEPPLAKSQELKERTERIFGKGWTPEVETMDTFVDSSWYYLRYADPHNEHTFADTDKQASWMPIDFYSGGAEHTTMHLLYSRFFYKVLSDLKLVVGKEPYRWRLNRGLILGPDGNKMSKSKGNVINPDAFVEKVGADSVKMYLAFIGPYHTPGQYPWDLGGIAGIRRFLERVWRCFEKVKEDGLTQEILLHQTIKKVTDDIARLQFNTAISALMILLNSFEKRDEIARDEYMTYIKLLAPFAPHLADEIWERLGGKSSIHTEKWPLYDELKTIEEQITLVVQVNGKVRARLNITRDSAEEAIEKEARVLPEVDKWIQGNTVDKIIHVKNKLISFVVSEK